MIFNLGDNSNFTSTIPNTSTDTVVSLFNAMPRNSTRRYFCSGGLSDFPDSEKSTGYHLLEMYKADSVEGEYSRILLINNSTGNLYSGRCNGTTVVWTKYVQSSDLSVVMLSASSITVGADSYGTHRFENVAPSGYKILGVVGYFLSGGKIHVYGTTISNDENYVMLSLWNNSSASVSTQIGLSVLLQKIN